APAQPAALFAIGRAANAASLERGKTYAGSALRRESPVSAPGSAASCPDQSLRRSEGQPAPLFSEVHIADIGAQPHAHTHTDGNEHHLTPAQIARVEATNEIGRALASGIAMIEVLAVVEIIDEH